MNYTDYTPKCEMTVTVYDKNNTTPVITIEEAMRIAEETIKNNPHYKLSFKPAYDFIKEVNECNKQPQMLYCTEYQIERMYIRMFEEYNKGKWTFDKEKVYCPYWQMTEEEYNELGERVYQDEIKRIKHQR